MNKVPFIILIALFMNSCIQTEKADLLVHNARIYTLNQNFDQVDAMAISNGKIIDIGAENELKNRYQADQYLDAKKKVIYPGLIDAHCHFMAYGNTFFEVQLMGTNSWEEVLERTKAFAERESDLWITGRGWDQNDWENKSFPDKSMLDSLFPERAILLKRIDGHAAIANQKALELAGITADSKVEGGVFHRENGKLSGLLIDNAVDLVQEAIPAMNQEQMKRALLQAQAKCFEKGLTTVDDAMMENDMLHAIMDLQQSGELKMKVYAMLMPTEENKEEFLENGPLIQDKLSVRSFKYFADGALGSRGAKLHDPYHDDPNNTGLFLKDSASLRREAELMYKHGFQMNTHCIGDAANHLMLDIYSDILGGNNDKRWRIEHCQILLKEDFTRFKDFNIIPSVQPTHATSDMYWAEDRLGPDRIKTAYAYRQLMEQNGMIALGTDFPIEDIDPIKTFYAAVVRKDQEEYPADGFQRENGLSRVDCLKGMTIWAAISNFEEDKKGSLELGKAADFIIVNQDLMTVPEESILQTKVLETYVDGKKVY